MNETQQTVAKLVNEVAIIVAEKHELLEASVIRSALYFGRTTPQAISYARKLARGTASVDWFIEFLKADELSEPDLEAQFFQEVKDAARVYCKLYGKVIPIEVIDEAARAAAQSCIGDLGWEYLTRSKVND